MSNPVTILPQPQKLLWLNEPPLMIGEVGYPTHRICLGSDLSIPVIARAMADLQSCLADLLGQGENDEAGVLFHLQVDHNLAKTVPSEQAYEIRTYSEKVMLTGASPVGLLYAVQTCRQLLQIRQQTVILPAVHIVDWPDLKTRGHFIESRYGSNLMTLNDWQAVIDNMVAMKMNHLVVSLYGCWCVQYDGRVSEYLYVPLKNYEKLRTPVISRYYSPDKAAWVEHEQLPPMFAEDFFADLVAYGQCNGVTVLPLFNSFGHNTLIPACYPDISAKDKDGVPTLTGFCTSNPRTYKLLFDVYDQIIDRYLLPNGVDSFHIGLDEVGDGIAQNSKDIKLVRSPWCQCPHCAGHDRIDLFIRHAVKLMLHLKKRGMKHIYMYHDMLVPHGFYSNQDNSEKMQAAIKDNHLQQEAIIDWWTYADDQEKLMFQTTQPEQGLRRTVKPWNGYYHWTVLSHPLKNIQMLAEMGYREKAEGMLSYSAWDLSYDRNHAAQACYAWNFEGTGDLDAFRSAYINNRFPEASATARQAFHLLEQAARNEHGTYANGRPLMNRLQLLQQDLSYYFYSYVKADRPYPRHYPGEVIEKLTRDKNGYWAELHEIAAVAQRATGLFEEVARKGGLNHQLALRYAYEADQYFCLCQDFAALLEMMAEAELLQSGQRTDAICRIRRLAETRKTARLELMYRLETCKEPYLLPSHLRNQTILLEYFSDLVSYLKQEKPEKVTLDFYNNTHFAGNMFWKLR